MIEKKVRQLRLICEQILKKRGSLISYSREEESVITTRNLVTLREYFPKIFFKDEIATINVITIGQEEKVVVVEEFSPKKSQS
jgi:hypothetical protein